MSATLYPLGLDRLQWAARRELVMTMREARGIVTFAAVMIGCRKAKLRNHLTRLQIDESEYGGRPFTPRYVQNHPEAILKDAGSVMTAEDVKALVRSEIQKALELTQWNKRAAAKVLHMSRATLYRRISEMNLSE